MHYNYMIIQKRAIVDSWMTSPLQLLQSDTKTASFSLEVEVDVLHAIHIGDCSRFNYVEV